MKFAGHEKALRIGIALSNRVDALLRRSDRIGLSRS
jgi:hypothetical protein